MPDSAPRLPARASLEQLRKQAKELLRGIRNGDAEAARRVAALRSHSPAPDFGSSMTLADAQWVLAREYGFESWAKLAQRVAASRPEGIARYERFADEIARAYVEGDATAIREFNATHSTSLIWEHDAERMRRHLVTWYASTERTMELAVADARHLVARQSGFDDWAQLVDHLATDARRERGTSDTGAPNSPLYRIDEEENAIEVRGPMTEREWDTVFAVMKERGIARLRGAGQITDAALERVARLDHVTGLDLSFAKRLTSAGLRHLARLPLDDLQLGGWGSCVDDAALEVLEHLPRLQTVSLVWAQRVSDAGVAHLAGCERLRSVNLMGTPTGDGALRALGGKAELCHLDAGTRVTPAGLEGLRDVPLFSNQLPDWLLHEARASDAEPTHLSLHPKSFVSGGLDALATLPGIFSLRFFSHDDFRPLEGRALEPVARMAGLESLWCNPSDGAMAAIATMPRLRKLMCQDTRASDDGWVALGGSRSIESIWARKSSGLRSRGLRAMARMPALRRLAVDLGRVPDPDLTALATLSALRDLTPIGLGDDEFRHVGACTALETLTCMYTRDIGDAATSQLTNLHALRNYYAGDTSITDRSLAMLAGLPSLESVELWNCPSVTNDGLAALAMSPRLRKVIVESAPRVTREVVPQFASGVSVTIRG